VGAYNAPDDGPDVAPAVIHGLLDVIPIKDQSPRDALFLKGESSLNKNIITAQRADTGEGTRARKLR
jgi:hypothetical protein